MTKTPIHHHPLCLLLALLAFLASATGLLAQQAGGSPVKIFILAGQSNMLGQGNMTPVGTPGTLEYIVANDPGGDYQFLVDGGGAWVVRDDVWIRDQDPSQGGLTVGYGSNSTTVGPELGFGHHIGDLYENQVLIVKAAWGGKSLAADFRPPSSGGTTGFYYNEILRLVTEATANLGTYFPDYDGQGYEIAGFGWHQGWNDRVTPAFSAEYETNMANFIRDIRTALGTPGLPFVIATTGMDGGTSYTEVELAQLAMANTTTYPEFAGNVAVIDTRTSYEGMDFWQPVEFSPVEQGYHWNRNAKSYVNIGLAMGDAVSVMAPGRCPFRPRATGGPGGVTVSWQNGTDTPTSVQILRNGSELAAAAPAGPPSFLDATAEPGLHDYELLFTMPGDPCDPLTMTFNGGITGLGLSANPGAFALSWTNNMAYTAIEVRRNGTVLEAALSGAATSYTDASPPTTGLVTYTVVPTNGSSAPAAVQINLDLRGQLGVLDLTANGGINPATGSAWQVGDEYRLAFVSSATTQATSSDITTYNTFVQGLANAAGLGGGTWKVAGSTATVDARDNTGTNPSVDTGVAVFLVDGVTKIAGNNVALWSGLAAPLDVDEHGNTGITGSAHTGSETNGTAVGGVGSRVLGGSSETPPKVRNGSIDSASQWMKIYNAAATTSLRVYAISEPLTVVEGSDSTPPTLLTFADNVGGGPILVDDEVTYTVTFSEPMNAATVGPADFENAAAGAITVDNVSPTGDPAVFEVVVTATGPGALQLRVAAGASLEDLSGNLLDSGSAGPDDTIITIINTPPALTGELGVLDVTANGGINPATGAAWQAGDQYRLAFVTSATTAAESADIATYNTFVQGVAAGSSAFPDLGNGTWKVIGSTQAVTAKANTGTDAAGGVAVLLMDGTTVLAYDNADLWNGSPLRSPGLYMSPYFNEEGIEETTDHSVFTGSVSGGTQSGGRVLGTLDAGDLFRVTTGKVRPNNSGRWMQQYNAVKTNSLRVFALSEPLTVQSTGGGNAFSDWIAGFPGLGGQTGFTDDPDGDGKANGLENFFGANPGVADAAGLGAGALTSGASPTFTLTHPQNAAPADDVSAFYEWSTDLDNFHAGGASSGGATVTFSAATDTPSPGITTVTATITGSVIPDRLFVRLGVTQN